MQEPYLLMGIDNLPWRLAAPTAALLTAHARPRPRRRRSLLRWSSGRLRLLLGRRRWVSARFIQVVS